MKAHKDEIDKLLQEWDYKFLWWENGWTLIKKPEYIQCRLHKHKLDEVEKSHRGSENVVSCDICKIYWKYDCSD